MKKLIVIFFISAIIYVPSCKEYLDIVPDNAVSLEYFYSTRDNAIKGLAKAYSYLPNIGHRDQSMWLMSDEYLGRTDWWNNEERYMAERIIRGYQNEQDPFVGDWSGTRGGKPLYEAIRQCNIFLENINNVKDMTQEEVVIWSAQVKFLKGYYHFLLLQKYGPIIIRNKSIPLDAPKEELYRPRQKIEECFTEILKMIDEAIPNLKIKSDSQDAGQIDQIGAKAIKARILLFRASPFYNGNSEYYEKFRDHDDQPFFPMTYNREKWKDVIDACNDAMAICAANLKGLYEYEGDPYLFDMENFEKNPQIMKTVYDLRMLIVDPWNRELLWGFSNYLAENTLIPVRTQIRYYYQIYLESLAGSLDAGYSASDLGATYAMLERYYTKNGLPPKDDLNFDDFSKHNIVNTPKDGDEAFEPYRGVMQSDVKVIQMYLDRELRFYTHLGVTGGYWRGHQWIIPLRMVACSQGVIDSYGGKENMGTIVVGTVSMGRGDVANECLSTGIGIQKFVHPESVAGAWQRQKRYPFPFIRYADLLLMKAEALNEYSGPSQEAYDLLNAVRNRAGVYDVEYSWGEELGAAKKLDYHKTQEGLRDIILHERSVELAFEGSHFWDMLRHKRAPKEYTQPVFGWDQEANQEEDFFQLQLKQGRRFTITDCLWPIDIAEMNRQGNLIQNPGWR